MNERSATNNCKGSVAAKLKRLHDGASQPRAGSTSRAGPTAPRPPPWQEIIPLGVTPIAMPFPLEVLPDRLRDAVLEIAAALNAPPDFAAVPLLVLAGGAIGMSRVLEIAGGHKQSALLYAGVVADPGSTKTPALGIVRRPTDAIQKEHRDCWDRAMKTYTLEKDAYDAEMKTLSRGKDRERPTPVEPRRPILRRTVVSDTTPESLIPILRDNPRGFVMVRDELSAWVSGMDAYKSGKGTERQFWCSNWSSEPYYGDRAGTHAEGYQVCAATFIPVVGCLTPDSLGAIRGDERGRKAKDDGFIDRVVFSFPEPLPARREEWRGVGAVTHDALETVIRNLSTLEMVERTDPESGEVVGHRPRVVNLTRCGRDAWEKFTQAHADEANEETFPPCLKGPWSKLRGYCGRLALILHHVRWACGEPTGGELDGVAMHDAAHLVAYFKNHCRKVHHVMDGDPAMEDACKVLAWIRAGIQIIFSQRDAHRGPLQRGRKRKAADAEAALKILCDHGHVRQLPAPAPANGRQPSPAFEVNPACHS